MMYGIAHISYTEILYRKIGYRKWEQLAISRPGFAWEQMTRLSWVDQYLYTGGPTHERIQTPKGKRTTGIMIPMSEGEALMILFEVGG